MPLAQNVVLSLHLSLLVIIVVILWVKAPHQEASVVFGDFYNGGGWSSTGLSLMVGQISAIYAGTSMLPCWCWNSSRPFADKMI